MSNREPRMGYPPATNKLFRGDLPHYCTNPHALGIPTRLDPETRQECEKLFGSDKPTPELNPAAQLYMTPSDTPGVLLAAHPIEVKRSLDRIEMHLGTVAALKARDTLRERAVRENYPWHIAAIDAWTYERTAKAERAKQGADPTVEAMQTTLQQQAEKARGMTATEALQKIMAERKPLGTL